MQYSSIITWPVEKENYTQRRHLRGYTPTKISAIRILFFAARKYSTEVRQHSGVVSLIDIGLEGW